MDDERFEDRRQAGLELAKKLKKYTDNSVVVALPRGGVETAVEVASRLDAPLDVIIARKIGHPYDPEYAIGAVTETGPAIWNEKERIKPDAVWLVQNEASERAEAKRRRQEYVAGRKRLSVAGKTVILVDDGMATGLTMHAAINEIRAGQPGKIVIAVPVAPRDTIAQLFDEVDEIITVIDPDDFGSSIGAHYENFPQLSDDDVIDLLDEAAE